MKTKKLFLEVLLLACGCFVALGTSKGRVNETWVVSNLYEGETAVPTDHVIELTVGYEDFELFPRVDGEPDGEAETHGHMVAWAEKGMATVKLREKGGGGSVDLIANIEPDRTLFTHDGLEPDTDYILDLTEMGNLLMVIRTVPEPINFSTQSRPTVTGVWRIDDTVLIAFSEPMDNESLRIDPESVDLLWEEDGELHSISADLNRSGFVSEAQERLFMFAPITWGGMAWIKVSRHVRGRSGVYLDGDEDHIPGEVGDDHLVELDLGLLSECYTREDVPAPCVHQEDVQMDNEEDPWWW